MAVDDEQPFGLHLKSRLCGSCDTSILELSDERIDILHLGSSSLVLAGSTEVVHENTDLDATYALRWFRDLKCLEQGC